MPRRRSARAPSRAPPSAGRTTRPSGSRSSARCRRVSAQLVLENLRREQRRRTPDEAIVGDVAGGRTACSISAASPQLPLPDDPRARVSRARRRGHRCRPTGRCSDAMRESDLLVHHPFDASRRPSSASCARRRRTIRGDDDQDHALSRRRSVADRRRAARRRARRQEGRRVRRAQGALRRGAQRRLGARAGGGRRARRARLRRPQDAREGRARRATRGRHRCAATRTSARATTTRARDEQYTDLSLLLARPTRSRPTSPTCSTSSPARHEPPQGLAHGALVAPDAAASRRARPHRARDARTRAPDVRRGIAIKVNGLSDPEVVRALYRASQAGVRDRARRARHLHAAARRAGTSSDDIRVVSVVGRFLEHSRIYRFENGGDPELLHRLVRPSPAQPSPARRAARARAHPVAPDPARGDPPSLPERRHGLGARHRRAATSGRPPRGHPRRRRSPPRARSRRPLRVLSYR